MKNITVEQLESLGACNSGLNLFKKYCGNSIEVTEDNARKVGRFLDAEWASENLLTEIQLETYEEAKAPLWKTYEEAKAPLWKTYEEAKAPLWKTYKEAEAPLWKTYLEARSPLLKAYMEAEVPLWKTYEEAKASLYKSYEEARASLYKSYEEARALEFVKAYNNDSAKQYKTRDGLEVVIHTTTMGGEYPIHGAYKDGEVWEVASWTNGGDFQRGYRSKLDLVEVPQILERWVLVFNDGSIGSTIYETEVHANTMAKVNNMKAVKVEIQV